MGACARSRVLLLPTFSSRQRGEGSGREYRHFRGVRLVEYLYRNPQQRAAAWCCSWRLPFLFARVRIAWRSARDNTTQALSMLKLAKYSGVLVY